jgi:hypothetical protein
VFACNFPFSFRLPKRTEPQAGYSHDGEREKGHVRKSARRGADAARAVPARPHRSRRRRLRGTRRPIRRPIYRRRATHGRRTGAARQGSHSHMTHSTSRLHARLIPVAIRPRRLRTTGSARRWPSCPCQQWPLALAAGRGIAALQREKEKSG